MITPGPILDALSTIILITCLLIAISLPRQTLAAFAWWREYLSGLAKTLWLRFLAWRQTWWEQVRDAAHYRHQPGRWD